MKIISLMLAFLTSDEPGLPQEAHLKAFAIALA